MDPACKAQREKLQKRIFKRFIKSSVQLGARSQTAKIRAAREARRLQPLYKKVFANFGVDVAQPRQSTAFAAS
jgi:hypothetical protein